MMRPSLDGVAHQLATPLRSEAVQRDRLRNGAVISSVAPGADKRSATEFSFFLAMPTMMAAFAHSLLKVRHHLAPERAVEIAIGFVMAFVASVLVVRPFLAVVRRAGFAPFAWYRIVLGLALFAAIAARWL